jgi:hypothetical protein
VLFRSKKKNEAGKSAMEALKARVTEALANVQNILATLSSADAKIQAVVSNYSGRVMYISKRLKEPIRLGAKGSGGLETGDEITTDANSSAQVQCLEGRGTIDIGENTKLKVERSDSGSQVMGLVKGKIHSEVEKAEDFQKDLEEGLTPLQKEMRKAMTRSPQELDSLRKLDKRGEYEKLLGWLKAKFRKKFEVRTGASTCSIRGTRFIVSQDSLKGTVLTVLDGTVEMTRLRDKEGVPVNAGYRITATADGTLSEPEKIDTTEIGRWWEK